MPIGAPKPPEPKQPRTARTAKTATVASQEKTSAREEGLKGIAQIATGLLILTKKTADAGAVSMHSGPICHEVAELANEDEKIAGIVDRLTAMGPYAALITATMPLVIQLLVNHDRLSGEAATMFGGTVMSKEALSAKVQAEIDQAKAQFLTEAREAQEAAQKARDELAKVA